MKKLSGRGQRWLKGLHTLSACMWVGAAIVLTTRQLSMNPENDGHLYGILATMDFIDIYIIIPGAMGVLLTGIIYSVWTHWGWFRHNWITVKWVICIYGVVFGTYPLGPWMSSLVEIAKTQGLAALNDPTFVHNRSMLLIFGTFQALTLVFAVLITALRPWRKNREHRSS